MLQADNTSRSSSCLLQLAPSTLQAYIAKHFRSPAPATTGDILCSTRNSHQLMRMFCLTGILTTIILKLQDSASAPHYQPTLPTYRVKEEKGKIVEDKKRREQLGQQKGIGPALETHQFHTI